MGSSASLTSAIGANGIFIDDKLKKGESIMRLNKALRTNFVKYIKEGKWSSAFDNVECSFMERINTTTSVWTKFGYKSPHCSGGAKSTELSMKPDDLKAHTAKQVASLDPEMDDCLLFQRNGLRAVLITVLLPLFLESSGHGDTTENSVIGSDDGQSEYSSSSVTVRHYTQVNVAPAHARVEKQQKAAHAKNESLYGWLIYSTSKFSKDELIDYLASTSTSWVQDFLDAIQSLPAVVSLSTVNPSKQESRIIYSNSTQNGHVGANMHEVYSTDCSPGGAAQLSKAIFEAKKYKRCLTSYNGICCLRALRPIFNHQGQHVYTLALESEPFKDPVLSSTDFNDCPIEETFQQIEDLLLLVPLLIRNYKCQ